MDCTFTKETTGSITNVKESGEKDVSLLLLFENYLKAMGKQNAFKKTAKTAFSKMSTSNLN